MWSTEQQDTRFYEKLNDIIFVASSLFLPFQVMHKIR